MELKCHLTSRHLWVCWWDGLDLPETDLNTEPGDIGQLQPADTHCCSTSPAGERQRRSSAQLYIHSLIHSFIHQSEHFSKRFRSKSTGVPTWHWGQAWCSSGRTRHSSWCGRLRAGMPLSLLAFSSAVSRARRQYSQARRRIKGEEVKRKATGDLCVLSIAWSQPSVKGKTLIEYKL